MQIDADHAVSVTVLGIQSGHKIIRPAKPLVTLAFDTGLSIDPGDEAQKLRDHHRHAADARQCELVDE
jgi:hypothetical protein